MAGPLDGLTVLELAGLGPAPFACYILAGLGARVVRVERPGHAFLFLPIRPDADLDRFGRETVTVDLKTEQGRDTVLALAAEADVLVEGFRPGVMERLGLGPEPAMAANPRLIYGRMSGYGQHGPMAARAGHDLNYIAISGVLSLIGRKGAPPTPPLNLVGDYGGGSMVLVAGILAGLVARERTGAGQVVDAAMVDGSAMLAAPIFSFMASGLWPGGRGENLLDSGCPFYDCYETSDAGYMAVAALEPQFFAELVETLALDPRWTARQYDRSAWGELRDLLCATFRRETREYWTVLFEDRDACVTPVLSPREAAAHPHNVVRGTFARLADAPMPRVAPRFSGTPATGLDKETDSALFANDNDGEA